MHGQETPSKRPQQDLNQLTPGCSRGKRRRQERVAGDRYIPARSSTDLEYGHHVLTGQCETPKKRPPGSSSTPGSSGRCLFSGSKRARPASPPSLLSFNPTKRRLDFSEVECGSGTVAKAPPKLREEGAHKILDGPGAAKNFYYNLVDWGANNIVLLGLKESVYYWDASSSQAFVLPQSLSEEGNLVTCVKWKPDATKHIFSQRHGATKLWDSTVCKLVSSHVSPTVYSASWQGENVVTLGRGDGTLLHWDIRTPHSLITPFSVTSGIICGLQWDPHGENLAVGCNDNKVQVIKSSSMGSTTGEGETLTMIYQSAVKALAWHPSQRGILATGSGQNDQRLVVWDLAAGSYKNCIDTKSQVTGVLWSPDAGSLLTSHGHFDPNLRLWDLKENVNTSKLTGHSNMIVSIAMSPINQSVMSLSADESLRLWNVFARSNQANRSKQSSMLFSLDKIR